jgi:MFS family permease
MEQNLKGQQRLEAGKLSPRSIGAMLVVGHGVKHFFNAGFFVLLPELQIHLGLNNSAIGVLSTIRTVGSGVANFPAGYITDRLTNHWAPILGLSIIAVGIFHLLMGISTAYWLLVLTSTLASVGITFWHPPAIAALSQMFPRKKGFAIAMHGTGGSFGEALGPISVGALLGFLLWRTVLQIGVVPAVLMGALAWTMMRGFHGESGGPTSFKTYLLSVAQLVRSPALVTVLIVTAGFSSIQAIVMTFLPIYLRVDLEYSAFKMSAFLSAAQIIGVASQPIMGFLSDRFGRNAVILPSMALLGVAVLAVPAVAAGWQLLLVVMGMGAFVFSLMSIFLAAAMDVAEGDVPATTVSLVFGAAVVFSSFTPGIAGVLADMYGVRSVFPLAAGIAFVATGYGAVRSALR